MSDVPFRLARRPRDDRGYAIPFTQHLDAKGVPDFRVLDKRRSAKVIRRRLCSLCGEPMRGNVYFVGGPLCATHGKFYDPPMHKDCAVYALTTCPHLARSKGKYSPSDSLRNPESDVILFSGEMDTTKKAEWFGLMEATGYRGGEDIHGMLMIEAKLPWVSVEKWRDGARFYEVETAAEVFQILREQS